MTLVMQGNINYVTSILSDLCLAADTAQDSWLTRLKNNGGTNALIERFEGEYAGLAESKLEALLVSQYDDEAKTLAEKIEDLREFLKKYTECSVKADSDEKEIKINFEEHTDESYNDWGLAATEYLILTDTKYEDGTLYDLVNNTDLDFSGAVITAALFFRRKSN